jgi:hypothetical protein
VLVFARFSISSPLIEPVFYFQAVGEVKKGVITNASKTRLFFLNSISIHTTEFFGIFGCGIASLLLITLITGYFQKQNTTKLTPKLPDGLL